MTDSKARRPFDPANGGRPPQAPQRQTVFGAWLEDSEMPVAEIAEGLEVTVGTVYQIARGAFKPGRDLMFKIEEFTEGKVPVHAWKKGASNGRNLGKG